MVSNAAYRIIKKAVILRLESENIENILESYPKLSDEQKTQMIQELTDEGYISE